MERIGDRIKTLRTEAGMSQAEMCQMLGVSCGAWSKWESCNTVPREKYLFEIAKTFGVTKKWLESGLGEKTAEAAEQKKQELVAKKKDEEVVVYNRADERRLKDITFCIANLKSMDISKEDKRRVHKTLSEIRAELESKVLFGN